jgi:hypothetical protein
MSTEVNAGGDPRHHAAAVAQRRAYEARRRAAAALEAAEHATTEYTRRAHHRVADLHDQLALTHEDHARSLRAALAGDSQGD